MGILGKFFGAKLDHPPLDSSTLAARQLESVLAPLEKWAGKTNDPLQIVPAEDSAYIAHQDEPRYVTQISDREVVAIPSTSLLNNLEGVVAQAVG